MTQARWCLEPVTEELSDDARSALQELVARTVIDPSKHREEAFTVLLELHPSE